jgi:hypothetical protein
MKFPVKFLIPISKNSNDVWNTIFIIFKPNLMKWNENLKIYKN